MTPLYIQPPQTARTAFCFHQRLTGECHQERVNAKPQKFNTWQLTFCTSLHIIKHITRELLFSHWAAVVIVCILSTVEEFSHKMHPRSLWFWKISPFRNFPGLLGSQLHSGGILMSRSSVEASIPGALRSTCPKECDRSSDAPLQILPGFLIFKIYS